MAIDPNIVTTVKVGDLPPSDFNLNDKIPHEIGETLFSGTIQRLADLIGEYLGTSDALAFNPTTVMDGGTLPSTSSNEWMLVGKGTFHNVGGGLDIVTTEELNAITSNGSYWSLAVQIPINVELAGITQNIRSGYTETTPSEDAVFKALALKLNISDAISAIPLASETVKGLVQLATSEETLTGVDNTKAIHPSGLAYTIETKTTNSAGAIQGFAITNNGNGTVNIASGTAYLRSVNDQYAPITKYTIPAVNNLVLADNANNYVLVDYNGGTPAITVTTNGSTINTETNSIAAVISRVGNVLDWISLVGQNNDANAKIRVRFLNQEGIRRANGAVIGFANRNLTLTAGTLFSGLIRINSPAFNTASPDTFTYVYNNGSVWTRVTGQTQVNNTQYNNAGTLATMPNNTFRTDYVYLLPNNPSKLYVVYGTATYANITLARTAPVPSALPSELQVLGLLVGRQIIEKNATAISEVSSAFSDVFTGAGVPEHNALAGLNQGDYQHLTVAQLADIAYKSGTTFTGTVNVPTPTTGTNAVTKDYADALLVGVINLRGVWDASTNLFPTTGGSGTSGAVRKGDLWYVSVAGVLAGKNVNIGDSFFAVVNTPGQTSSNWNVIESNIGYVPANDANVVHITGNEIVSDTKTFDNIKIKNQPIGSNLYKIRQDMAFDDWWAIYGEGGSSEKGIMVFEVGDNGEPFSGIGQKFSFRYNADSSGVAKTVFEIDYNEITANANIGIGISPQAEIHAYSMTNTENIIDAPNGSSVFTMTSASLGASFVGFSNKLIFGKVTGFGTSGFLEFARIENTGNVLIGTSADDLTNKLQVNGTAKISSLAGTGTRTVVADASGNLSATDIAPTSGTYTPTYVAGTNVTSLTNITGKYTKIGNLVTVFFRCSVVVSSAASATDFTVSFPASLQKAPGDSPVFSGAWYGVTGPTSGTITSVNANAPEFTVSMRAVSNTNTTLILQGSISYMTN